ncbi:MAG: sulfite exporter TauE/SafE family protein [Rickettsiales bacterium]|nr:sulfite exporter TauE/SafE family protein [Pseudomonadota bacterium]MDA0967196.1 sulfite exporter TauE/SafE family protein [Pseudomonadota bacterium]MDG4544143.1 sulfite exporter TauE/SafE family protein [Rickettsiales bacterium]MDG4546324.1 sulfite exporter TauE/SafE family protein [Rickettsiales bacterium]MDG4548467.1 sulfite exporter TauE/SafE family protein [Rickettsiales bacterium]
MYIYLPIAEMPVNIFLILFLGGITGVLSGMFGVGGGFLMTPLLMLIGIPPAVAVSSSANQIIAASFSGFLAHLRRANVDIKMGIVIIIGGFIGSSIGVSVFAFLQDIGQIDLAISLCYVLFLGTIGTMMAKESITVILAKRRGDMVMPRKRQNWLTGLPLPFKMEFKRSDLKISILLPVFIGMFTGILVSLMGIGGGFVMIPAMIYILGMPTSVVIGTSLFIIVFITANVTILQSVTTHTVDVVLAMLMLTSSVIGAQFGTRVGLKMPAEQLRAILAMMVLAVVIKLAIGLFVAPNNPYTIAIIGQ